MGSSAFPTCIHKFRLYCCVYCRGLEHHLPLHRNRTVIMWILIQHRAKMYLHGRDQWSVLVQAHPLMVASLISSKHQQVWWMRQLQITLPRRTICKGADLGHNPIAVMIIRRIATRLGTAMVDHIHVEMVLTIMVMEAGVTKTVEIKIGLIGISLVETPTCSNRGLCLGLWGHHHRILPHLFPHHQCGLLAVPLVSLVSCINIQVLCF